MEIVLTIAGSDPSAGAGIQQDLKTITATGCYAATAITAITVQNTLGVTNVMPLPGSIVAEQIDAVFNDLDVKAVKIGQIPNLDTAQAIVSALQRHCANHNVAIVYDPVMISTSGRALMEQECIGYICSHLFGMCSLVTPNIPEAQTLLQRELNTPDDIDIAGGELAKRFHTAFLLKGGHSADDFSTDSLYLTDGTPHKFSSQKIATKNLHGTGCTLSSAIASYIAQGATIAQAVSQAHTFVHNAIKRSTNHGIGHGNGPILTAPQPLRGGSSCG